MQSRIAPLRLRVSRILQETPDVKTFRLEAEGQIPFDFMPGQFIVLSFEIHDEAKGRMRRKNRAFSISSSPVQKQYLEITVKKTGLVSTYLHESVGVGDRLNVKNRSGEFYFQEGTVRNLVMIAGGTGIAPLMSMIRFVIQRNLPVHMTLIYSNKTPKDIIFSEEIGELQSGHPNFRCVHTITRPEGYQWSGRIGRIDLDLLRREARESDALYYLCGPEGLIRSCEEMLRSIGVDPARIRVEKWD